ncbi:MAG TPA: hypothetical protein PLP25_05375 [Candidatus Limiplasma sp.]|nr:hypothetical protein [Candidatus Limiplasma sp.]HPS81272.1 hypothetical protein [Candidatus Limiplasma sp.]
MKPFSNDFSRMHAVVALAALVNIVLGVSMALGAIPYVPFGEVHGFAGAIILPLFFLLPLLSKKRKNLYSAIRSKLLITKRDKAQKNLFLLSAKGVTLLMAVLFLMQLVTGALMETGLAYKLFPGFGMLGFHTAFLYVLPTLIVLHFAFMLLSRRKPRAAGKRAA